MFGKPSHTVPPARLAVLRRLPMFESFTDAELAEIDSLVCQTVIAPGNTLVTQGRAGRQAFLVISGEAEVRVDGEVVAQATAGDVIGEMALLDNCPRSATVTAITPLEVFVIDPREFGALISDPRTARWLATVMARRLRDVEHLEPDEIPAQIG